jgi:hypothetical protein
VSHVAATKYGVKMNDELSRTMYCECRTEILEDGGGNVKGGASTWFVTSKDIEGGDRGGASALGIVVHRGSDGCITVWTGVIKT